MASYQTRAMRTLTQLVPDGWNRENAVNFAVHGLTQGRDLRGMERTIVERFNCAAIVSKSVVTEANKFVQRARAKENEDPNR